MSGNLNSGLRDILIFFRVFSYERHNHYTERKTVIKKIEECEIIANCIGPDQDYEKISQPLIKNLLKNKLIHCDPVHLGINALPDGQVIKDDGTPSNILYTIGLTLKGILWESVAAPEIRVQAENLPKILLSY